MVLLILVGVSIAMLTGENGILTQATEAKKANTVGEEKERIKIAMQSLRNALSNNMVAYANNPARYKEIIAKIDKYNPYVTATAQIVGNGNGTLIKAETTNNKNLEEAKAAKEEILGGYNIPYARNPSLKQELMSEYNQLVAIEKNKNPSAKEQAGAVKGIGKTIYAYNRNPSLRNGLFGRLEENSCLIKDKNLEEVQVARAETLEIVILAINRNPSLVESTVNIYNHYIGLPPEQPSSRVQAITLYNNGNLLEALRKNNSETNEKILNNYEKVNINITANTEEIQAASLANLGRLYWTLPFAEETERTRMLEIFKAKLYKEITSNSPIIQAAKYYSDGYYDSSYQEIMKIEDETERKNKLKILEEIRKEFEPNIKIDYTLEEVQIAKVEFLNTIYDSYWTEVNVGGRYFLRIYSNPKDYSPRLLKPSEEYFARK